MDPLDLLIARAATIAANQSQGLPAARTLVNEAMQTQQWDWMYRLPARHRNVA